MPRKPVDPSGPVPGTDRTRRSRARRRADGLPSVETTRRALVGAVTAQPVEVRAQLIELACATLPPEQRAGFRRVAAALLRLDDDG